MLVALTVRSELGIMACGVSPPPGLTGSYLGVLVATLCLWREKRHGCVVGLRETPQCSLRPQLSRPQILRKEGSITPNVLKLIG